MPDGEGAMFAVVVVLAAMFAVVVVLAAVFAVVVVLAALMARATMGPRAMRPRRRDSRV